MTVDEQLLGARLGELAERLPGQRAVVDALGSHIRTAGDADVVRINAVSFAGVHGLDADAVIDVFLHARRLGLLTMDWHYVCPGCGDIVESFASLTSATAHYFCQTCSVSRDPDLSDFVEITFSVAREVRQSRYHDPLSLTPEEYFLSYRFTGNGVMADGTPVRDHLRAGLAACAFVEPRETRAFSYIAQPGYLYFTNGPALVVTDERTDETREIRFAYTGPRAQSFEGEIAAGPVVFEFTNATERLYPLMVVNLQAEYAWTMRPFLSGSRLLSNQTFLDLFASETIIAAEGLEVRRLTLLFSDIQGSTAMYERVGDMKAFDLVRLHFGFVRDAITANSGALVKTIGDAVMASFHDPRDAVRAALDMHAGVEAFNAEQGGELISLKVGAHTGACLAVTLNGRLDYFGQTVNLAARVQGLARGNELVLTEQTAQAAGVELLEGYAVETASVELKGIPEAVRIQRVSGSPTRAG